MSLTHSVAEEWPHHFAASGEKPEGQSGLLHGCLLIFAGVIGDFTAGTRHNIDRLRWDPGVYAASQSPSSSRSYRVQTISYLMPSRSLKNRA